MNWYLAKIVFQINCGNGLHTGQFDEQLRLIAAENKEDAFQKAQSIGKQEEEIFINQKQQLVQWKFINVSALYKFTEMIDGAELFSRIEERRITTARRRAGATRCVTLWRPMALRRPAP